MNSAGNFYVVGQYGCGWSASSSGSTSVWGAFLRFSLGYADPLSNTNRTHGFPVRCVQELAVMLLSVFLFFTFACSDSDKSRVQRSCLEFLVA